VKTFILSAVIAFLTAGLVHAATVVDKPAPILVELFTSEGCSSCPPADAWLQKMDSTQPLPDAQLIVLSEHVDYWDQDGWKDPYSSHLFTDRQSGYVHALGLQTAYTPQVVIDGADQLALDNPQQVVKVFQKATAEQKVPVHLSAVNIEGGKVQAHVEADGNSMTRKSDIYLAIALDHADSKVSRGENSGRHLAHVAVVRSLNKVGSVEQGKNFNQDVRVKLSSGIDPSNLRVIVFVQQSGTGRVLGAALQKNSH
jgi:hypothetical protein